MIVCCELLEVVVGKFADYSFLAKAGGCNPEYCRSNLRRPAGGLVLAGVLLGLFIAPAFFGLSAFVGAGLMFAGITGWCVIANVLRVMPWNRRALA